MSNKPYDQAIASAIPDFSQYQNLDNQVSEHASKETYDFFNLQRVEEKKNNSVIGDDLQNQSTSDPIQVSDQNVVCSNSGKENTTLEGLKKELQITSIGKVRPNLNVNTNVSRPASPRKRERCQMLAGQNYHFYKEYCRLYYAKVILSNRLQQLLNEKQDLNYKLTRLEANKQKHEDQLGMPFEIDNEKKKRHRRVATEIARHYKCPIQDCPKSYGSEGSLNQHIKIKHPLHYDEMIQQNNAQQSMEELGKIGGMDGILEEISDDDDDPEAYLDDIPDDDE